MAGINAARLWGGGLATAAVAALVALVGSLVLRGILDLPFLAPEREGVLGNSATGAYVFMAAMGGIVATLVLQVLFLVAPAPLQFYTWIAGLQVAALTLLPFTTEADYQTKVANALINFFVGMVYLTLLPRVATSAVTKEADPEPRR